MEKKTNNEIKRLFIKSTLVYNLLFACLALALFIYNINLSDWNKLLYLLNGLLGIAFTLFPIWISHYIIEIKYANSLVVKNNSLGIIYNIFTPTPFIAILFILICGIEVYEYMPKYNYSIISLFIFLFTFLFIPLLSSWTFNSLIIYRKKQKNKLIYIVILITSLLWLIPIYHISPFVMKIFAYQDKEEKIYYIEENFIKTNLEPTSLIVEVEKHKTKKTTYEDIEYNKYVAHCGKIYLDTGDKTVFKRWNSDNFVQIPSNKIFEYQGRTLTCEIIVVWENYRDFVRKLFQFKNH